MGDTLDTKKVRLVNYIRSIRDEDFLDFLEKLFEQKKAVGADTNEIEVIKIESSAVQNKILVDLLEPGEEKTDLEKILREQNYQGPNKRRFKRVVKQLNIQEPIEDLLALLTK